jgi:ATP-binding cassette subfamily B protein
MQKEDLEIVLAHQRVMLINGIVLQGGYWAAIAFGLTQSIHGTVSLGAIVFLASGGYTAIHSLGELVMEYSRMTRDLVSITRIKELLDEPIEVCNEAPGVVPECIGGLVECCDVTFRYPHKEHAVLNGFGLTLHPGKMTALVGISGAGKSTIVKLLARMLDPAHGQIRLDGVDVRTLDRDWYRRMFATVQQDVDVFDATLRDNIAYGFRDATDAQIQEAIAAAHLTTTIADAGRFPEGLQTQVGDRGVRLSGGERQRVGIARAYLAILRGARILILDEATSSLDSEAELAIQEMLGKLRVSDGITIVAIAHRLATIQWADSICVLEDGHIVEQGSHVKLLQRNGLYARLVGLQRLGAISD